MRRLFARVVALSLCALFFRLGHAAEDPTAGLYVCTGKDGMHNIVNHPTGANCQPYRKGLLTSDAAPPRVPLAAKPVDLAPAPTGNPPAAMIFPRATPAPATKQHFGQPVSVKVTPLPATSTATNPAPPAPQPALKPVLFPPAPNFTGTGDGELYRLFGISKPEKIVASTTPEGKQIWVCPQSDGTPVIVESQTPLQGNCQPLGRKASAAGQPVIPFNRGKPLVGKPVPKGEIATNDDPPQDIYRCLDKNGKPNFVGENQRQKFHDCQFFSRSFAKAQNEFIHSATAKQTLAALAVAGVRKSTLDYSLGGVQGLQCIGAGSIEFNGQTRRFNCATRSFDYTPGTSGGNVRLGNQQASIAAHNLNYLNTQGSCGGTVTSDNGRVFHLEPTKDCPQEFIIEAQKIKVQVERQLNINTSGAFRERQRALAAQINQISQEVGIDPFLVHAIISAESAYKTQARSHVGAQGLMQLMPGTARRFGVTNAYHTGQNIRGGATYLKWLLNYFNGNMELAIAAYNAGEGNVRKYGNRIPPFIETRAYVPKVLQYYRRYRNNPNEVGL